MTINLEKTSIVLEMISFFLVTIDLLGRKRIEVLQNRFEKLISVAKSIDLKAIAVRYPVLSDNRDPGYLGCFLLVPIYLVSFSVSFVVWGYILYLLASSTGVKSFLCLVFVLVITTTQYLITFFVFLLRNTAYILIVILEKIIDGIFTVILSLFNRLKLEGVMLIVGALLFLLSKILAYINAS
jgi:hypothetical protein